MPIIDDDDVVLREDLSMDGCEDTRRTSDDYVVYCNDYFVDIPSSSSTSKFEMHEISRENNTNLKNRALQCSSSSSSARN